jgi:beta-lactamase class A
MSHEQRESPSPLAEQLASILAPLGGRTAVAARRLDPQKHSAAAPGADALFLRADEVFPAASLIKVGIAVEVLRRADLGQFSLDERFDTAAEPPVGGGGVLDHLHPAARFTLRDLCFLMLAVSDNTAANFLLDLVGMGEVNATLSRLGLAHTKLARHFMDFAARAVGRDNVTSAGDMAMLLALLQRNALPQGAVLRELLLAQQVADDLRAWLPPETPFAFKTGSLEGTGADDAVFSVAGLLGGSTRSIGLCVLTAEQRDLAAAHIAVGQALRAIWDTCCAPP